jgi:calcium/calmodulin-dependent protein kinase I
MLGTPKQLIPFSRDCAFADDVRISESQVVAGSNEQEKTLSKVAIKILSK